MNMKVKIILWDKAGKKGHLESLKICLVGSLEVFCTIFHALSYFSSFFYLVTQLGPTCCDPMDCSRPGSSVLGISQARILEWVAISFSRGSSWPRDWTCVSCLAGKFFTTEPQGKILSSLYYPIIPLILRYETTNNLAALYYHSTFNNFMERKEWYFHFASFKDKY